MRLFIFAVQAILLLQEQSKIILVDLFLLVVRVLPNKAAVLPVLRNGDISQQLLIFVNGIHIKNKNAAGIQIVIYQPKYLQQIFFLCYIVDGITDAHHCPHRAIQFKFPHILQKVENIQSGSRFFLHGDFQHIL